MGPSLHWQLPAARILACSASDPERAHRKRQPGVTGASAQEPDPYALQPTTGCTDGRRCTPWHTHGRTPGSRPGAPARLAGTLTPRGPGRRIQYAGMDQCC